MSRPPRTQFPGATHHVTARGNRKADIFHDKLDYLNWQGIVDRAGIAPSAKPPPLPAFDGKQDRPQAIVKALHAGDYSPAEIAEHFQVSTKTVQRIRAAEAAR